MREELKVWWLSNDAMLDARLKPGAPAYLKEQLADRRGRNGRGRLWVAREFGRLKVPRLADREWRVADLLPGGIVIRARDERFCVGGRVASEELVPEEAS